MNPYPCVTLPYYTSKAVSTICLQELFALILKVEHVPYIIRVLLRITLYTVKL